jgi:hypothetical protein
MISFYVKSLTLPTDRFALADRISCASFRHYEDLDQLHHLARAHARTHTHTLLGDARTPHISLLDNTNNSNAEFAKTMSFKKQRYSMHEIKYVINISNKC